jgi:hypothetical protein
MSNLAYMELTLLGPLARPCAGGHLLYAATLRPFEKLRGAPSNVEGRQRSGSPGASSRGESAVSLARR